ncbi:MAG TPA: gluconate 2-dehydrogenase subunit 3 family protein [Acidobacteriaceae bacterium]
MTDRERVKGEREPLRDPATGAALPQREQPGYYPGFSTLSQKKYWDATTRKVVEERVAGHRLGQKSIRFFTHAEAATMLAVVDRIMPQEDRTEERRIPILPGIDERLYENRLEGFRFEDMPPDQEAYRLAARAFEQMAQTLHGISFHEISIREQERILRSVHDAKPLAAIELWKQMNVERFWALLVSDVVAVYYAHPWAWDEVGFGGPAYPRGYMRLEEGEPEPWEVREQRYEWVAPADSISDVEEPNGTDKEHQTYPGQGGTH